MSRLLLLVAIAWVLWLLLERGLVRVRIGSTVRSPLGSPPARGAVTLVRCSGCGTHVPRGQILTAADGSPLCSERCRSGAPSAA